MTTAQQYVVSEAKRRAKKEVQKSAAGVSYKTFTLSGDKGKKPQEAKAEKKKKQEKSVPKQLSVRRKVATDKPDSAALGRESKKLTTSSSVGQLREQWPDAETESNTAPVVRAVSDFTGQMPCDLSFLRGDLINLLTQTQYDFDWWEGELHGRIGIFPANYVKPL
ncbi:PREDICTED: SH3 domain-containing YSC84-like protein 1 [Priapulus caudatus]|uniref:SH3 domain-containing YSC84-like protein 1 n=1 Tax=Priapulus caudatus TaxID=37621 RepID=A0ABM1EVJ1_PRICU|nr:PREDICTED: SH3 domain-containing YSC84-like protein 1 [Priapulus caudatus]